MAMKRKRSARSAPKRTGRPFKRAKRSLNRSRSGSRLAVVDRRVARIERTIETKEGLRQFADNIQLPHNNINVINSTLLFTNNGNTDPMAGIGTRVGDQVTFRGLAINMMCQNSAQRPRVFYRLMVIKTAKGDVPTRATLFKGLTNNKMIDQINTERYTIVAQKRFTITAVGAGAWTTAAVNGHPDTDNGATAIGGVGSKICKMWIPGRAFGRNGNVKYENESTQPKFFDYHFVGLAYDWFGTPQDINNVGSITAGYIKQYFKDA